jgi:hypothetical protein
MYAYTHTCIQQVVTASKMNGKTPRNTRRKSSTSEDAAVAVDGGTQSSVVAQDHNSAEVPAVDGPVLSKTDANPNPRQGQDSWSMTKSKERKKLNLLVTKETIIIRDQKLLRMRAILSENIARSGRDKLIRSKVVAPIVPAPLLSRRRDHPLESYVTKGTLPDFAMLDPLPSFGRKDLQLALQRKRDVDARHGDYIKHSMGSGIMALLKSLGCRPATAGGPGGDLFNVLAQDNANAHKTKHNDENWSGGGELGASVEPVGPNQLQYTMTAEFGSSERDWWVRPGLLKYVSHRTFRYLPQHLMIIQAWARVVMVLSNLLFLACKIQR